MKDTDSINKLINRRKIMKRILKTTFKVTAILMVTYVVIVTILSLLSPRLIPNEEDDDFDEVL